jgi:hypothetical protein
MHELDELVGGIAQDHAAAGIDHRPLGFQQQLHRLLDLSLMTLDHRVVGTHRDRFRIGVLAFRRRDVLRDVDQHRAWAAALGQVEGLLDGRGQVVDVLDQEVVLDAGPGDADGVDFLEGVLADVGGGHLAGNDDHRDRIHVGGGDAGDGVGHPGAGSDQGHPDPSR